MNPLFAAAIDPLFERAIDLLKRIEQQQAVDPEGEQQAILNLFEQAEHTLGPTRSWYQASYAIAAWIDEMLLGAVWNGTAWWSDRILEMRLFQSRECSHRFFDLAKEAAALRDRDVVEVYFNCVLLGFRGMYRQSSNEASTSSETRASNASARSIESHPQTIERWIESFIPMVDFAVENHTVTGRERPILDASPLMARERFIWWSVAACILFLLNVAMRHWQNGA